MSERTYTEAEIKAAFWRRFHRAGSIWLNYLGSNAENEESTQWQWECFLEQLQKP